MGQSARRYLAGVTVVSALLGPHLVAPAAGTRAAATRYLPAPTSLTWIRVSPADPRALYAGGATTLHNTNTSLDGDLNQPWLMRSTNAGATWSDYSGPAGSYTRTSCGSGTCFTGFGWDPITIGADGKHLFAVGGSGGASPASGESLIFNSRDAGLTWDQSDAGSAGFQYGAGPTAVFLSPVSNSRVYALLQESGGNGPCCLTVSSDGGHTWIASSDSPSTLDPQETDATIRNLVPDPLALDTVYANLTTSTGGFAARSDDAGMTWTPVVTPTVTPAITSFSVATDPLEPGLLVGHGSGTGVGGATLGGRIYLSSDRGRTWREGTCPGAWNGTCPTVTLAAGLGTGHHYAFFSDGVHAFDGAGPSGPRLALSDRLPIQPAAITAVEGGARAGDPVYVLGKGRDGPVDGVLYVSTDAGVSWQLRPAGLFPAAQPPVDAPGSLDIPHARFRVAAPFVKAYRSLGLFLLGLPITNAYYEGTTLTQDFEHMRLELHGQRAVIAALGTLVQNFDQGVDYSGNCVGCVPPMPSTVSTLYFGCTDAGCMGVTLSGAFLRFWRAHGGLAVFGAPITQPYRAENGDGSHRMYTMQLFERARLELHPENQNPAFRVELGLLGDQYLVDIGWLMAG